ncbi:MAG: hypothetical protein ABGZ35_29415, partial [Planctomycetaceae bacterium]
MMRQVKNTLASETTSMHCAVTALLLCCVFGVGTRSIHAQESPPPFNGPPVGENWINVQPAVEHGSGQCNGCRRCCPQSNGTLFRWSSAPNVAGGPNLDEPLVTDRPDFTEASSTVGLGVSQIEFGYTYVYGSSGDTSIRTQSFGEPLLRYGIGADWLEFRLGVFPLEEQTNIGTTSSSTSALSDMYLGVKIGLTPQA